jgi:hydroxylamine reductase
MKLTSQGGDCLKEEKIISALVGLVGASYNNPKADNLDNVIIKSLAFPLLNPKFSNDDLLSVLNEIYSTKNIIAPNCAVCKTPCGNTSDYDMNRLYNANDEIRDLKLQIISKLEQLASCTQSSNIDSIIFYKGISYVGYDLSKEILSEFLNEIDSKIKNIEGSK